MKFTSVFFSFFNLILITKAIDLTNLETEIDGIAKIMFEEFIKTYEKEYEDAIEYQIRYKIFVENLLKIKTLRDETGSRDFGITPFMDLTFEEFLQRQTGVVYLPPGSNPEPVNVTSYLSNTELDLSDVPESFEWISKNAVTSVKQQGNCGSCWAFSAMGTIEGQLAIKHRSLIDLSEQQLLDCERYDHNCNGGYPHVAFNALARLGGCMTYQDYPYTARVGQCRFNPNKVVAKLQGGKQVHVNNEDDLIALVHSYGPVSVAIYASKAVQVFTWPGVFDPSNQDCPPGVRYNHAVLIVGYGSQNGKRYWLIKNSWGTRFGDKGFSKLVRGRRACGVEEYVAVADLY